MDSTPLKHTHTHTGLCQAVLVLLGGTQETGGVGDRSGLLCPAENKQLFFYTRAGNEQEMSMQNIETKEREKELSMDLLLL